MTPQRIDRSSGARTAGTVLVAAALLLLWRLWSVHHLGITLYVDEAYYWGWAQALDWGYYSKPPVIAALIAASTSVLGDSVLGVKALSMSLYALTGLVMYGWVRDMADERAGAWAAVLTMSSPLCMLLGLVASTDAPLMLCWACACWALWRALNRGHAVYWVLLGLAVGVGLLSKYTMAAFGASALVACALALRPAWGGSVRPAHIVLAIGFAMLCLAPNLLWNADHGWPTLAHTAQITLDGHRSRAVWQDAAAFLLAQAVGMGVLTTVLALRRPPPFTATFSAPHPQARAFAWAMSLPLLGIGLLQALHAGAQPNWTAPSLLGVAALAGMTAARRGGGRWALALNVLLFAAVVHVPDFDVGARQADAFARMRGWDRAMADLAPAVKAHSGDAPRIIGDGRTVLAHAGYHWRALHPQLMAWNPQALRNDHYQLLSSLTADPGPALFLCDHADAAGALSRFARATPLAESRVVLATGREVHLRLYAVEGFKGYAP